MLEGNRELRQRIERMLPQVKDEVEQALVTGALMVERDAKINAPVDTGRLRTSISHETENFGGNNPSVKVGTNVEYGPHVEFGTSKQSAKPFLFPAYNSNKSKILKELAKAFQRGVGL